MTFLVYHQWRQHIHTNIKAGIYVLRNAKSKCLSSSHYWEKGLLVLPYTKSQRKKIILGKINYYKNLCNTGISLCDSSRGLSAKHP